MTTPVPRALQRLGGRTSASLRSATSTLTGWPPSRWATAAITAVLTALLVGLPTAVVPNPVFGRAVPVQWWNYPALAVTALLGGIVLATFVNVPPAREAPGAPTPSRAGSRLGTVGGLLSFLAVGCPVCNKLVLLLLGTSGALTLWAPVQPLVAVASVAALAVAALRRLAGEAGCPVPRSPAGAQD